MFDVLLQQIPCITIDSFYNYHVKPEWKCIFSKLGVMEDLNPCYRRDFFIAAKEKLAIVRTIFSLSQ